MTDQVQQIKERINIVEVIGQYVKLTRAGKNYKGLSPFHKEKTPSFYVSPDKGMYYDFSSGQGGDVFTFVQHMEGLDFKGALHMLAERAGVELIKENKGDRDARERLYNALEDACAFYEARLREHPEALAYLHERGLEDATIRSFRIGFAPEGWHLLNEYLTHEGYRLYELEEAGLVKKSAVDEGGSGRTYDRFRSRIMFPIMDAGGRVVAFSGRIFGDAAKDEKNAKYLNSPETPLYDKSRILYGYHKAKQFIRKYDFSILVEGQMDIVMSHQAGYTNTVAVSGTGLTEDHLALLERLSSKLVMAFDADTAGIASSGRAATLALRRGMDVKVATVPLGKDPADCIKEDKDKWREAVKNAVHVVDFMMQVVLKEHKKSGADERTLALSVRDTVLPFVARVQSGVDQAHFVRNIANQLGIAEEAVWRDVRVTTALLAKEQQSPSLTIEKEQSGMRPSPATVPSQTRTRRTDLERTVAGFLFWQETLESRVVTEEQVRLRAEELQIALEPLIARYAQERETLTLHSEISFSEVDDPQRTLDELFSQLALIQLREEREALARSLREAEREHDEKKAQDVLARFTQVSLCIEKLAMR